MGLIKGIIFLIFLTMAIGFALYNDQPVSLRYYFDWESIPLPLFLWAFLALILGLVACGFYTIGSKINLRSQIRRMRKIIEDLEKKRISSAKKGG